MAEVKKCCEVGTIFYTSWGYEQTNVEFYEVTHSTAKMVTVQELETVQTEDKGQFTGCAVPRKGKYKRNSKPIKRKLDYLAKREPIFFIANYIIARIWDNKPKDFSTYNCSRFLYSLMLYSIAQHLVNTASKIFRLCIYHWLH